MRLAVGALAVALVLGACGDDDDSDGEATVCAEIDAEALATAVGQSLDDGEASATSCTFRSSDGDAVIGFSSTELDGVGADTALRAVRQSCDPDTIVELGPRRAEVAFSCEVQGELTVAAAGEEHLAVLAAVGLDRDLPTENRVEQLLRVVDGAFAAPAET